MLHLRARAGCARVVVIGHMHSLGARRRRRCVGTVWPRPRHRAQAVWPRRRRQLRDALHARHCESCA